MSIVRFAALGAVASVLSVATVANSAPVNVSALQYNGVASNPSVGVIRLNNGSTLQDLDDPNSNQGMAGSAFMTSTFSSSSVFTSSFTFAMTNTGYTPQGDGLTFMIQSLGPTALGGTGGGIGADGLTQNVGVGFQSWDNDHATIFTNGDVFGGSSPLFAIPGDFSSTKTPNFLLGMNPVNVVNVSVAYNGTTLSYTALNTSTNQSISDSLVFDLSTLGPQVYFGFTGATGLSYSVQDVYDWDLDVQSVTPVPEPTTWALMILGFGGIGSVLRRRRTRLA